MLQKRLNDLKLKIEERRNEKCDEKLIKEKIKVVKQRVKYCNHLIDDKNEKLKRTKDLSEKIIKETELADLAAAMEASFQHQRCLDD